MRKLILLSIMISILPGCKKELNKDLASVKISSFPYYKDIKAYDHTGKLLFEKNGFKYNDYTDLFLYSIKNSVWKQSALKDSNAQKQAFGGLLSLMNYYYVSRPFNDSSNILSINSLLNKLCVNGLIDFRKPEGQKLSKIIIGMEFGDIDSLSKYGILLNSNPTVANNKRVNELFEKKYVDSLILQYNSGLVKTDDFNDALRDKIIADQFIDLVERNGTILLVVISNLQSDIVKHDIYMYYQYINSEYLQIGKMYLNPYGRLPYYYE